MHGIILRTATDLKEINGLNHSPQTDVKTVRGFYDSTELKVINVYIDSTDMFSVKNLWNGKMRAISTKHTKV
jgi:hypothetical protein